MRERRFVKGDAGIITHTQARPPSDRIPITHTQSLSYVVRHHQRPLPRDVLRQQRRVPLRQQARADVDGVGPIPELDVHDLHRARLLLPPRGGGGNWWPGPLARVLLAARTGGTEEGGRRPEEAEEAKDKEQRQDQRRRLVLPPAGSGHRCV